MGVTMVTNMDKIRWFLHRQKRKAVFRYGFATGKIRPYEMSTIEKLRDVYYGGIAASVLLLDNRLCQGHCYDRALLMSMVFGDDNFRLVDADIDGITLNPIYVDDRRHDPHYGNHCFVERDTSDGKTWVYDTTAGLVFDKDLYYYLENPKITKINDKEATQNFVEYKDIKNAEISRDRYAAFITLPLIEEGIKKDDHFYKGPLLREIELYKKAIDYEGLVREIRSDMGRRKYEPSDDIASDVPSYFE